MPEKFVLDIEMSIMTKITVWGGAEKPDDVDVSIMAGIIGPSAGFPARTQR